MRVLVNIRGCNGSGKSTVAMSMMDDPKMEIVLGRYNDQKIKYTIFPTYGWVALGTYLSKTGGMDGISTKAEKQATLEYVWKEYPDFDVVMEGVIDSTILSTYVDLFNDYQSRIDDGEINPRRIIVLNFLPPLEECIRRVLERNGGKPVKEEQIESKWNTVYRNARKFKEEGIISIKYDNSKIKKGQMLDKFFSIVNKYREE